MTVSLSIGQIWYCDWTHGFKKWAQIKQHKKHKHIS